MSRVFRAPPCTFPQWNAPTQRVAGYHQSLFKLRRRRSWRNGKTGRNLSTYTYHYSRRDRPYTTVNEQCLYEWSIHRHLSMLRFSPSCRQTDCNTSCGRHPYSRVMMHGSYNNATCVWWPIGRNIRQVRLSQRDRATLRVVVWKRPPSPSATVIWDIALDEDWTWAHRAAT